MTRYSKDVYESVKKYMNGKTNRQLAELINKLHGTAFDSSKMKSYIKNHKLVRTTKGYERRYTDTYPEEIARYIDSHYKGVGPKEMAQRLNEMYGRSYTRQQLHGYYQARGYDSGLDGRWKKGTESGYQVPKGTHLNPKNEFKKGNRPVSWLPVGSITQTVDGYFREKIEEPNKWEFCHKLAWIRKNGDIPEGMIVIFLDGDKSNYQLDNLALINRAENAVINRMQLRFSTKECTEAGINVARITIAARKLKTK